MRDALARPPAVVLIEGEAGIGKTRLVREALAGRPDRGARILSGSCPPLREPFPYGPLFDVLRTLAGQVPAGLSPVCGAPRPYLPELAERLPPACEPLHDHAAATHRIFRAVGALLSAVCPAVLVVEDLHWADDGTRDLIRFLIEDPPPGLATVLTYRREDLPSPGLPLGRAYRRAAGRESLLMRLDALDADEVRTLAAALTGAPVSARRAAELHERTAGIPFVLEEFVRGPGAPAAVPALLQEAMADRTAGLDASALAVVHAAAVLRDPVPEALVTAVAGLDEETGAEAVGAALRAGVLHDWGADRYGFRHGFRHGLAQQAVHEALLGPERRRLHLRAVAVLAAQEASPLVRLAHHARQAGALEDWRRYAEEAAEHAREIGDTALAVELLEGLLGDPGLPAEDCARLALRLSRAATIGLTHRRTARLLRRVVDEGGPLPDAVCGDIRLNLGLLLNNQAGDHRQGRLDTVFHVSGTQPNPPSWGIDRVDGAKDASYTYPNDGSGVTAYIADTGLYRQHSDFGGRASSGYDFIDNDADSADCHGHGTHVSGTVGGASYGVAKNVKLVGVRVLDCQGSGSTEQIAAGMDWIARNAKKPAVVNMSLGGSADRALDDAVAGVINAGIPVAVAGGNDSKDACNTSPARLPAAITLGSTESNDARSSFSNYGSCLDLFTPGGSIVSTKMGGGTQTMSGTSMATPHTAGAAALYLSAHPDATPQQVRDALVDNAQSGVVTGAGSGSPNKFLNVTKLGGPVQPGEPTADFTAQCSSSAASCAFDASASKDEDGTIASYRWKFGDTTTGTGAATTHRHPAGQRSYTAELTVTDNSGLTATASRRIDCYGFGAVQSLCFPA